MCGGVGLNAAFTLLTRSCSINIQQLTWITKGTRIYRFARDPELLWAKLWKGFDLLPAAVLQHR